MNESFGALMRAATLLTRAGRAGEATALIQRGLNGRGESDAAAASSAGAPEGVEDLVIDGCVFEVDREVDRQAGPALRVDRDPPPVERPATQPEPAGAVFDRAPGAGEFIHGKHVHASVTTAYKLYVPPGHAGRSLPMVVMLHGCTQNPDDFAAGTGMNELAREHGFFVLYPEQSHAANPQRCWNWFKHTHQGRGRGEPASLAAMTQAVMARYAVDERSVYIAGLSAGAAMAHVVALAYPEIFAAVGVHSGLARGAAGNVSEALAVMKSGAPPAMRRTRQAPAAFDPAAADAPRVDVPTIVFHGDADRTVHPRHGEHVVAAALGATREGAASHEEARQAPGANGRRSTRRVHRADDGRVLVEHWVVHGAGHAWSGGRPQGSYTDPLGPDASAEMLRFFLEHPRRT